MRQTIRAVTSSMAFLATIFLWHCGSSDEGAPPTITVAPDVAPGTYSSTQSLHFLVTVPKSSSDKKVDPINRIELYYSLDGSDPLLSPAKLTFNLNDASLDESGGMVYSSFDSLEVNESLSVSYIAKAFATHNADKGGMNGGSSESSTTEVKSPVGEAKYVITDDATSGSGPKQPRTQSSHQQKEVPTSQGPTEIETETGPTAVPTYSVATPTTVPGDITFVSDATDVSCSSDGGASYADCLAAGQLSVSGAGYDSGAEYRIKFSNDIGDSVFTWTPKTSAPGLTMSSCSLGIIADMTKAEFEAIWQNGSDSTHRFTVCLADDVVINGSPTSDVNISATNIELVGSSTVNHRSQVHRLKISGTGPANTARITGGTYQKGILTTGTIAKVYSDIWVRGDEATGIYIFGANSQSVSVTNCSIDMTNSSGVTNSIYIDDTAQSTNLAINSSTIKNTGTGSFGVDGIYVRGFGSTLSVNNSTIEIANNNYQAALRLHQTITATLTDTTIRADENANQAINVNVTNNLTLTRVTVETGQRGLKFSTSGNTVNIADSTFKHTGGTDRSAFDLSASSSQTMNNTSSGSGNLFCYVPGSPTSFLNILSSTPSSGSFTAAGTINGNNTNITACP